MRARTLYLIASFGIVLLLMAGATVSYPVLKTIYDRYRGQSSLLFLDVTDQARLHRHHVGAPWLGTFSASVTDVDHDGRVDLFVNNHERNRPYFYRNLGNGAFEETQEAIGLWENPMGPVFGKPKMGAPGFYLWLDPQTAIEGTWHLRWMGDAGHVVSGDVTTNTWFESARKIGLGTEDKLEKERSAIRFIARTASGEQGIDFKSGFPESALQITLRFDGKADPVKVFIGPRSVHPKAVPFELSLGDRHATIWGDYDNDGRTDLFITRGAMVGILKPPHGAKHEELFKNGPDHRFANVIDGSSIRNDYGRGREAQWVDYDNDGRLDLYVSNLGSRNLLFRNRGDGNFEEVGAQAGIDLAGPTHFVFADFNGDSRPDLLFNHPLRLFINRGGTFVEESAAWGLADGKASAYTKDNLFWGADVTVADFDNDGDLDVFVAGGKGGPPSQLQENRSGRFVDITGQTGLGGLKDVLVAIWGDFDNDGWTDLYTVSPDAASNRLFVNNGNKTFSDITQGMNLALTGRYEWDLANHAGSVATWLDYDGNGFLDLFLATRRTDSVEGRPGWLHVILDKAHRFMKGKVSGTHFLLKNTGNGNHWIDVDLVGVRSNRDGYGAKVYVVTQGGSQFQEAGAMGKIRYAQNHMPLHFGIGTADRVERIEVVWPSGVKQKVENIRASQVVRIVEPEVQQPRSGK
jgi:enediyne biosynthesis protein E4